MAPPDRAAGRLTPLCGRRKEPHPTISPSGPFLFDIHGNAVTLQCAVNRRHTYASLRLNFGGFG